MHGKDAPAEAIAQPAQQHAGFSRIEPGGMDEPARGLENGDEPLVLVEEPRRVALE
jgi:hypothetical protein